MRGLALDGLMDAWFGVAVAAALGALSALTGVLAFLEMSSAFDGPMVGMLGGAPSGVVMLGCLGLAVLSPCAGIALLLRTSGMGPRVLVMIVGFGCFAVTATSGVAQLVYGAAWAGHCYLGNGPACDAAGDLFICGSTCGTTARPDWARSMRARSKRLRHDPDAREPHE